MSSFLYYTYRESAAYGDDSTTNFTWELEDISVGKPPTPYNDTSYVGAIVDGKWKERTLSRGDECWVVCVQYSSGSTFGQSYGHGTVACICVDGDSAVEAMRKIDREGWKIPESYACWMGYFESIEDVYIKRRIVLS